MRLMLRKSVWHVLLFLLAMGSLAFVGQPEDRQGREAQSARVDELFAPWNRPDSPGCAVGVIKDGRFIYKRGYGMANLEHHIPISPTTVFRIGSTSKQFTAATVVLLAQRGKLSLDDDIRKYLPEMPDYGTPITIRHLIHHTSGIRDYLTLMDLAGMRPDDFYTDEEVLDLLARQRELNFKPGDEFLYSNSGYFLLSLIVKRATGKSLRELARELIFEPLGMNHTHFHDDHTMIVENRASGYAPKEGGGFKISMTTLDMVGDGGLFTSVEDLFRWDQNFYHPQVGGRALIDQLLTPGTLNDGKTLDYAFGLRLGEYKGLRMISHGGAFVGFRAEMIRFPEQRFSVICLCNLSTINPSRLARQVADIFLADQMKPEAKATGAGERPSVRLSERELNAMTGAFYDPETGAVWQISAAEGVLIARVGRRRFRLMPVTRWRFRAMNAPVHIEVRFEERSGAAPSRLRVHVEGRRPVVLERVRLVSPTPDALRKYVGTYFSEELQVGYNVVLKDGRLYLRHENKYKYSPRDPLQPTLADWFTVSGLRLHFLRDERGNITAFTMNTDRVKHLRFVRRPRVNVRTER